MSQVIVLNAWDGPDEDLAVEKMAKVFRMTVEQGADILRRLSDGDSWKFEHPVSDRQAATAVQYLNSLGFQAQMVSPGDEASMDDAYGEADSAMGHSGPGLDLSFSGKGGELFMLFLTNWIKRVFTLGIYHFWAKTKVRNYIWSNTHFAGDPFEYHGTPKELLMGFMKFSLFLILAIGVLVGVQIMAPELQDILGTVFIIGFYLVLFPVFMVGAMRYLWSRTSWRGIRFSFRGEKKAAIVLSLKNFFLNILTLGFYYPYIRNHMERFWRENTHFGNLQFEFTGEGREIFKKFCISYVLIILTLGLYWFWWHAYATRYFWQNTRMAGGKFRFSATGMDFFALHLGNLFIVIFTLGMGIPWVQVRNMKFFTRHLRLDGDVQIDWVIQEMQKSGALGDAAADAFDLPMDIG